jgi:hypothetical protein
MLSVSTRRWWPACAPFNDSVPDFRPVVNLVRVQGPDGSYSLFNFDNARGTRHPRVERDRACRSYLPVSPARASRPHSFPTAVTTAIVGFAVSQSFDPTRPVRTAEAVARA